MELPKIVICVLELEECDGFDRVHLVGCFDDESKIPPPATREKARARNTIRCFNNQVMNLRAFKINPPISLEQSPGK